MIYLLLGSESLIFFLKFLRILIPTSSLNPDLVYNVLKIWVVKWVVKVFCFGFCEKEQFARLPSRFTVAIKEIIHTIKMILIIQ
jgi:hypothetical protein